MIFLFLSLTSLSIIMSRSIHVAENGIISLFLMTSIPLCICHILFIPPSVDGCLDCFYGLAIANSASMNIGVHVPFQIRDFVSSGYVPRGRIAG